MDCERNVAPGAALAQCCCPNCNSMNIELTPIVTDFSDFEMYCIDCGEIWDADVRTGCAYLGKEELCPHVIKDGEQSHE